MSESLLEERLLNSPEEIAQAMLDDAVYYDKIKRRYWRLIDSGHTLSAGHADRVFTYLFDAFFKHLDRPAPLHTASPVSEILLSQMQQFEQKRK